MTLKSKFAQLIGRAALKTLRLLKRNGSSYPGKLALQFDKHILADLAKSYETIVITGTNGKTLTTALTVQALKQAYPNILTNETGSNMHQGIVSTFLSHKPKANEKNIAVLEVDEANLIYVTPYLKPKAIVVTNIFRDQLDRFGEIYTVYQKILDGIMLSPESTVIMNGDAPIFNTASLPNSRLFFGMDYQEDKDMPAPQNTDGILCPNCEKILRYRSISYGNLGKYYCLNCSFKRPTLHHCVTSIDSLTLKQSIFHIDTHKFILPVAGLYNIYNALAAYTTARFFNVDILAIQKRFQHTQRVFGRQEIIAVEDKEVLINLIKNPVGLNQVLDLLALQNEPCSMFTILNDNYADGQDVSWIWDGHYEDLHELNIEHIVVGGIRHKDMLLRLQVAGFDKSKIVVSETIEDILEQIKTSPTKQINVLATYTAMLELRKLLFEHGYVKGALH